MKNWLVVVMAVAAVASFPARAPAQDAAPDPAPEPVQEQPQGPTFRTGVDVIAVDVSVSDSQGNPVEDLLAPEFHVRVDGQPRRVVSAEHIKVDVEAARRRAANPFEDFYTTNLTSTDGRLIIIAVDQLGIRTGAARSILATASRFLDRLTPADRVAFVAYPAPGVTVDFTSDRARLRRAMELVVGRQERYNGKFNIGLYEAIAIEERADERIFSLVVERECGRLTGQALEQCQREILTECNGMSRDARQQTSQSLRGLFDLLRMMTIVEGPKTLILLSEGMVLDTPSELDPVIQMASVARVAINVLLMDVPRDDITVGVLRPTISEDRDLYVQGLRDLAGGARGALYNVIGTGENIFDRLASDMLAYYLLAVEQVPDDQDGERHRIDVEVRRRGVTVKSRTAFVLSAPSTERPRPEQTLLDALKAPFGVAEIPLRVTTFTYQDDDASKVRLLVAAEVGQAGAEAEEFTVGYALLDAEGNVVSSVAEQRELTPAEGRTDVPLDYLREVSVEPGVYSLRFGVVDSSGRRGGVIRDVNAWQLAGEEFALGDLMIGDGGDGVNPRIRPGVEPRISGNLGAFVEMYSTSPAVLEEAQVIFEIAEDQDSPALLAGAPVIIPGGGPTERIAQGVMGATILPAGRYVARARVLRGGEVAGLLVRPFILDAPIETADALPRGVSLGPVAQFDTTAVLSPEALGSVLDDFERRSPDLRDAIAEARAGRYGTAAVEALTSGDQAAAAFLKGLDWFSKGQLEQASTQLQIAAGPRRDFFPAAFYLGASLAAAGRERDAAGVWQMALGTEPRPSIAYTLFADARLRDRQPAPVIEVLTPAYERTPDDDAIGLRLARAYLMAGRFGEALPVLDGYLSRNPAAHDILFATVYSYHQHTTRELLVLSDADQAKVTRYVRAYEGPNQALLEKYLASMRR